MSDLPPLNALKAFEASGRHLNFGHAARELRVTQGAIAQQVRGLEAWLGLKLFTRHARGLALTDEGRRYLPAITQSLNLMMDATRDLRSVEQVVTISATPSFATRWLVPRLGEFSRAYPDLRLRIDASNASANFQTDGVDLAIRLGVPPFVGLRHDLLFSSDLVAVCHPDLTQGASALRSPSDLVHHVLLQDSHGHWPLLLGTTCPNLSMDEIRTVNFNQTALTIDAALAGQGVALTSRAFVQSDLEQGRLCQPFPETISVPEAYFIVSPRKPRQQDLVDKLRLWLLAQT